MLLVWSISGDETGKIVEGRDGLERDPSSSQLCSTHMWVLLLECLDGCLLLGDGLILILVDLDQLVVGFLQVLDHCRPLFHDLLLVGHFDLFIVLDDLLKFNSYLLSSETFQLTPNPCFLAKASFFSSCCFMVNE